MRRRMLLVEYAPTPVETYLRVFPVEVQWVTTTTSIEYNVESNTSWSIQ